MNENQTDIFGGVTPFQTEETKQDSIFENQSVFQETVPIQNNLNDVSQEQVEKKSESFNEMPFDGVNIQNELVNKTNENYFSSIEESEKNTNMEPIPKSLDENSGLKFLLVLGIIFAIFIIVLPFL